MKIYLLAISLLLLASCKKEAALTADPIPPFYTLPQGQHPYDNAIVAFHQKYGTYILYQFKLADFNYDYTSKRTDTAANGDPAYVGQAIQFLQTQVFDFYPEAYLKKTLPFKILLAAGITGGWESAQTGFATTQSMLAFGWANSFLTEQTPEQLKQLRGLAHRYYVERAIRAGTIIISNSFVALQPVAGYASVGDYNKYALGVVASLGDPSAPGVDRMDLSRDFTGYVEMITSHTYDELTAPGAPLDPAVDVSGKIQQKYDIVTGYFNNTFGVDLQAIGNHL